MKILFVQDSLGTGGAERSNSLLWYYLREQGHSVRILVLEHREVGIEKEILGAGFEVVFLTSSGFINQSREIASEIRSFSPDLVHSVLVKSTLRCRAARLQVTFRHVESLVNCTYDPVRLEDAKISRKAFYFYKYLEKYSQRFVDKFIAITNTVKKHYVDVLGIPENKIEVIYRGRKANVYLDEREALREKLFGELGLEDDQLLITHLGRQEFQKGHTVLLKAINSLSQEIKRKTHFLMLGRQGNASQAIEEYLSMHALENVSFPGHRDDVYQILAASDLFVFPSYYEGLGGSLIEAQAAGLPVVCSDIGVFREIVLMDQNALLFERGNSDELALSLTRMIEDPQMRRTFGMASLDNFSNKFELESIHRQMVEQYAMIIK